MAARKLIEQRVEKVWGRRDLPEMFGGEYGGSEPLGEIWFDDPKSNNGDLLVKYLFTSEKLSIQVHPNNESAIRRGYRCGKDEAWIILKAEPGAVIGIGLRERVSREQLRRAAVDGSIEDLIDWRPAVAGDILYSPAGTLHALGPGLTLIELQQNVDLTYRLYDYGRPRQLHLEDGIEACDPGPYSSPSRRYLRSDGREILAHGQAFVFERLPQGTMGTLRAAKDRPVWLVPVSGGGSVPGSPLEAGSVWLADSDTPFRVGEESELFVAYPGKAVRDDLIIWKNEYRRAVA